jgi:hypothetical protein
METLPVSPTKIRNPVTHAHHRHQVLWQITVPFIVAFILLLALAILAGLGANADVSRWADASLIWLIQLAILPALLVLATLIGLVYGLYKLLAVLPFYTYRAQEFAARLRTLVRKASDVAVEPVLKVNSFYASLSRLLRLLKRGGQ